MRQLKNLFCVVLLAAVCAGQTTAPSSSSQDQQNANPQPPVSPLQEPQKSTEAEQNKPKSAQFEVGNSVNSGRDQELGEIRLMTRHTEIGGDQTRSFRIDGENNLAEFNFFIDRSFDAFGGGRRLQMLGMYRGTDDSSIDPEHNSMQKAYARIYGPRDEYIFGDTLVNFSRLTFNQNVKGAYASRKMGDDWKLSGFGGIFIDRYGSLYLDLPGKPFLSVVSGARLERKLSRDGAVGLNLSSSDDRTASIAGAASLPAGTAPFPASNRVGSVDAKFNLKGVRLDGEFAYSLTDFDTRSSRDCPAPCDSRQPQAGLSYQSDWGTRLDGAWRHKRLSFRGSFARYQPDFASINSRQIADLQDSVLRATYELTPWMSVDGTFRRSNNDLKGQLPFQTTLLGPEARLTFHDLSFYRRGIFEVGYRQRNVDASDGSIERFVRMPYAEFSLPYHTTFFTIGYEHREAIDKVDPTQTSNTDHPYISFRGIYDLGGWHLNPTARLELERQAARPRLNDPTTPLQFLLDRDSNRLSMIGLFVEAPKWFILELAFRDASATLPALAPGGLVLIPSGYSRPSYKAAMTYKIANDENKNLIFSFERNNNYYFTTPNFDERVVGVTFVYKFGKRASGQ